MSNVECACSSSRTDDPNRANLVHNLGIVLLSRFARFGDPADLNRAVKCTEEAIALTPPQTQRYTVYLHHLATCLHRRFTSYGNAEDLERSIASSKKSVADNPDRNSLLALSYYTKYVRFGHISDLEDAVTTFELCLTVFPKPSHQRAVCLANFGECLTVRFDRKEDIADINRAILLLETSISLVGKGETLPPGRLLRLGVALQKRFQREKDVLDLERAISYCDEAVRITSEHPERWVYVLRLGSVLLDRFDHSKDCHDLDRAIPLLEQSIRYAPNEHPDFGVALNTFSHAMQKKFDRLGDIDLLNHSISLMEDVVELTPVGDPNLSKHLSTLAISLRHRYGVLDATADLEKAISTLARSLRLTPGVHLERYTLQAEWLYEKFKGTGRIEDLNDAISMYSEVLGFMSESDDRRTLRVQNLDAVARLLGIRFQKLEVMSDLDKAISTWEDAIAISVEENESRAHILIELGQRLRIRYEWLHAEGDIHRAVSVVEEAIRFRTEDDHRRPTALFTLGSIWRERFVQTKETTDLEESIRCSKQAVDCVKVNHPLRGQIFSNLGTCLHKRFEHLGSLVDIDEAILMTRKGIDCIPDGQSNVKADSLNQLAWFLFRRHNSLSAPDDLRSAIATGSEAVLLTPLNDANRPVYLCTLGAILFTESATAAASGCSPHMESLSRSISLYKEALDSLKSKDYPGRPLWTTNLANSLSLRFLTLGSHEDLNRAISMLEETTAELPRGHWCRPTTLYGLAHSYVARFLSLLNQPLSFWHQEIDISPLHKLFIKASGYCKPVDEGDVTDIDRAISVLSDAVEELQVGHHFRSAFLLYLGQLHQMRFKCFRLESDFVQAIQDLQTAATAQGGQIDANFRAAITCAEFARSEGKLDIAFAGYTTALGLLPLMVWKGLDSESRLIKLEKQTPGLACDAASCAIELGKLEKAVEFLELGRSLFWGQASELRADTIKLRLQNAALADRLEQLGKALDKGSFGETLPLMPVTNPGYEVEHFHRLAEQWDKKVHEIRQIKEFEDFLLPTPFEKLREAAALGPVIILNISRFRCDAVIASTGQIKAVSLPDLKPEDVKNNATDLGEKLKLFSDGKLHASKLNNLTLRPILAWLWRAIGSPLMSHIEDAMTSYKNSHRRVWWCPTGYLSFLPIHAAGLYEGEIGMADTLISSYTMNLTSLCLARRKPPREDFRFTVVGVTVVDEIQRPLPMVAGAVRDIQFLKSTLPFEAPPALEGSFASIDVVIVEMQKSDWVHFSCHGHQDIQDPMESHLVLHDGPLSVSRIARDELRHIELVHLAACHTASGMAAYPDESFHISAAFQFTGAKGVLATMWAIHDEDGAVVTEKIYKYLFRKNRPHQRPDASEAARALSRAVRHLRRSGASESLHKWVPFIHIGI